MELGDVSQPFGKEPDKLWMKRVADANLLDVSRLKCSAVDLHPRLPLFLVIGRVSLCNTVGT
jgi:hypothetical protein